MKRTLLAFLFCLGATVVQAQWFNLNSPTSSYLYSTYFANYDTGYAVGGNINQSVFLKTVNGGVDWNIQTNTQTKWLYDLVFLNDTVGVACGYDGAMYKTSDAGANWVAKPSQTTAWLYAIAKRPDGTLFATGTDGTLIKSVNAGDNWSNVVSSTGQTMLDIQFYDNNYGAAVGYAGEMIYTTDGGNNWAIKLMGTPGNITGVWMLSPDTMWTVGLEGKIYKTTNAGTNFSFYTPGLNDFHSIFFSDDLNGYIAGYQKIYQTSNGGNTWNEMAPYPTANGMKDIFVSPDNRVMYGVGDNGAIIKNINTIGVENIEWKELGLYPNPADQYAIIPLEGKFTLYVFDTKGCQVMSQSFDSQATSVLDLTNLTDGNYIINIVKNQEGFFGRIVVKHD